MPFEYLLHVLYLLMVLSIWSYAFAALNELLGDLNLSHATSNPDTMHRIRESPPQFENRIMARVYVRTITRSTMYQKAPCC